MTFNSLQQAQEDAEKLRSVVMPMEKEIAALKDKLTEAEDKIKELEASKVVKSCNPFAWNQSSALML